MDNITTTKPKKDWRKYYKEEDVLYKKSKKTRVECKCPKCSKKYSRFIFWTGRIPARLYCENCLKIVDIEFNQETIPVPSLKSNKKNSS